MSNGPKNLSAITQLAGASALQSFLTLDQAEMERVQRIATSWRFYLGQQWEIQRENNEPLSVLNYVRPLTDKRDNWLVGQGVRLTPHPVLAGLVQPVIDRAMSDNGEKVLHTELAQSGSVSGDVFLLCVLQPPTMEQRRRNPYAAAHLRIKVLPSESVFVTTDPLDYKRVLSVRIESLYYEEGAETQTGRTLEVKRFTQVWTDASVKTIVQGKDPVETPNTLGEIPIVHIPNFVVVGNYYGLDDVSGLMGPQRQINETATDIADVTHYTAAPITVVTGAKAGDVEIGAGKIWSGLPDSARVSYLEGSGSGVGHGMDFIRFNKESMFEMAAVPLKALGADMAVSNTSAAALEVQYQVLLEFVRRKHGPYALGYQRLAYLILRYEEMVDPRFRLPHGLCKNCSGRILNVTDDRGNEFRRCYRIDPRTYDLQDPKDVPVPYVRHNSTGPALAKAPLAQAQDEQGVKNPSTFDPAPARQLGPGEQATVDSTILDPSDELAMIAPEPEEIEVQKQRVDEAGNVVNDGPAEMRKVVPTGCIQPAYLDPYYVNVKFGNPLPTDLGAQADVASKLTGARIVSRLWAREQMNDVDPARESQRVAEDERRDMQQMQMATAKPAADGKPGVSGSGDKQPSGNTP